MLKTKASVMSAEEEVDKLPDCDKKTELKEEIKEVKIIMFNEFRELLNNLKIKFKLKKIFHMILLKIYLLNLVN